MAFLDFLSPASAVYNNRGAIGSALSGTPGRTEQLSTGTPEQGDFQSMLMEHIKGLLGSGAQGQLGGAAATQFNQQTLPSIAERFTSLGGGGGRSSAFGQQVGQAQQGMLGQLLGQQQQQIPSLMGGAMQPQFENLYHPREAGGLEQLLSSLLPMLIKAGMGAI